MLAWLSAGDPKNQPEHMALSKREHKDHPDLAFAIRETKRFMAMTEPTLQEIFSVYDERPRRDEEGEGEEPLDHAWM